MIVYLESVSQVLDLFFKTAYLICGIWLLVEIGFFIRRH